MRYLLRLTAVILVLFAGWGWTIHFPHINTHGSVNRFLRLHEVIHEIKKILKSSESTWKAESSAAIEQSEKLFQRRLGELDSEEDVLSLIRKKFELKEIPEEFDARQRWPNCPTIREVRDQGVCSSCWAVATASAFSDRLCIAGGGPDKRLSEGLVLSCCSDCGKGCHGGSSQRAWKYFLDVGLPTGGPYNTTQGCQPYEIQACDHTLSESGSLPPCSSLPDPETPACQKKCTNPHYPLPYKFDIHKIGSAYLIKNNATQMQLEILNNGPVVAAMSVFTDFYTYKSGVYQHVAGERIGAHAVRVLGWGSDSGTDFWLAANSWNSNWGEDGFFRIRRGANECGVEERVTAGLARPL